MITGHYGITTFLVGATRMRLSGRMFVALLAAAVVPDFVDVVLAIAGICSPYGLYSHTVNAVVLEVAVVAGVVWLATGSRSLALLFSVAILLHRPADYFTGNKLVWAGGEIYGLRLYERPFTDFVLEVVVVLAGWWTLRRRVGAPAWVLSKRMLSFVLLIQTAFLIYNAGPWASLKPTGCVDPTPALAQAPLVDPRKSSHVVR